MITSSDKLAEIIAEGMAEKKAHDICILDMRKINNAVTDFFVVAHGESNTQVDAIAKSVEVQVKKIANETALHKEGTTNAEWILLDYFNVVAHIFIKEKREYYNIEGLWADAKITQVVS